MIIDTEYRSLFFCCWSEVANFKNELLFKRKNFVKSVTPILSKLSFNQQTLIEGNIAKVFLSGIPFKFKKNFLKQHDYFIKIKKNLKVQKIFLSLYLSQNNLSFLKSFLSNKKNLKIYDGIEIIFDWQDQSLAKPDKILSFIKKLPKELSIIRFWGTPVDKYYDNKVLQRGGLNEIFYYIQNLPNKKIILGHLGNGMEYFTYHQKHLNIFRNVFFSTSHLLNPKVLLSFNPFFKNKIIFGSDYPFITYKNYNSYVNKIRNQFSKKVEARVMFENAKKL